MLRLSTRPYLWVMDTEHMMACLIDGKLFDILNAGTDRESFAFVVRDNTSPSGFRTVYQPYEHKHSDNRDHQVTPKHTINEGGGIDGAKKDLVVSYLQTSFGLTSTEAVCVADEAHATLN